MSNENHVIHADMAVETLLRGSELPDACVLTGLRSFSRQESSLKDLDNVHNQGRYD